MSVYAPHAYSARGGQERVSDHLELELQVAVVRSQRSSGEMVAVPVSISKQTLVAYQAL